MTVSIAGGVRGYIIDSRPGGGLFDRVSYERIPWDPATDAVAAWRAWRDGDPPAGGGGGAASAGSAAAGSALGPTCPYCGTLASSFDTLVEHVATNAELCRGRHSQWAAWEGTLFWDPPTFVKVAQLLRASTGAAADFLRDDTAKFSRAYVDPRGPGSHIALHMVVEWRTARLRLASRSSLLDLLRDDVPRPICERLLTAPSTLVLLLVDVPRDSGGGTARSYGLVPWEALVAHGDPEYLAATGMGGAAFHWSWELRVDTTAALKLIEGSKPVDANALPAPLGTRASWQSSHPGERVCALLAAASVTGGLPKDGCFHFGGVDYVAENMADLYPSLRARSA